MLHPLMAEDLLRYEYDRMLQDAARARLIREADEGRRLRLVQRSAVAAVTTAPAPVQQAWHIGMTQDQRHMVAAGRGGASSRCGDHAVTGARTTRHLYAAERRALCALRARFGRERGLFTPQERSNLRFVWWLYHVGRLAP